MGSGAVGQSDGHAIGGIPDYTLMQGKKTIRHACLSIYLFFAYGLGFRVYELAIAFDILHTYHKFMYFRCIFDGRWSVGRLVFAFCMASDIIFVTPPPFPGSSPHGKASFTPIHVHGRPPLVSDVYYTNARSVPCEFTVIYWIDEDTLHA